MPQAKELTHMKDNPITRLADAIDYAGEYVQIGCTWIANKLDWVADQVYPLDRHPAELSNDELDCECPPAEVEGWGHREGCPLRHTHTFTDEPIMHTASNGGVAHLGD